jgi:hypothetical protein
MSSAALKSAITSANSTDPPINGRQFIACRPYQNHLIARI